MVWTPRVTVAAVIAQDNRFLMVRERVDGVCVINQPAGHLEAGESLVEAVRREVLEETARHFEPQGLVGIYRWQMPGQDRTYIRFCFAGGVGKPVPGRVLDADIIDTAWLSIAELSDHDAAPRSPLVQRCIQDYLAVSLIPLETLRDVH